MSNAELIGQDPGWVIALKGLFIFAACVFLNHHVSLGRAAHRCSYATTKWTKPSW